MSCTKCGEPTFGSLCCYCRGDRQRPTTKFVGGDELRDRLHAAARRSDVFIALARDARVPIGEAVLAFLLAARSLVETTPELPSFDWYANLVSTITAPKDG